LILAVECSLTAPFETTFTVTPHPDKITQEKLRKGVEFF